MTEKNNPGNASLCAFVFWIGMAFIISHEIDAVSHSEWRLLPLLNLLDDDVARDVFVLAHVPLFAALLWLVNHGKNGIRRNSRLGVDVFLVVHAGLHRALSGHALYGFDGMVSDTLIYGGALAGLAHMVIARRNKNPAH